MNRLVTDWPQRDSTTGDAQERDRTSVGSRADRQTWSHRGVATRCDRWLVRRLLAAMSDPLIAIRLWDGTTIPEDCDDGRKRVLIRDRSTLCKLIGNPTYEFGEAYSNGSLEVEGDISELLMLVYRKVEGAKNRPGLHARLSRAFRRFTGSTLARAKKNICHHYDIGNDFYRLWLDWQMVYTCAYFADASHSLEQAQLAKMDHVCRKVRLRSGDTVVEAGCGWGALALHMAKYYGVRVRAFNISGEQIRYARERARREGLKDRVEFVQEDWRKITGQYDVFVSIGMLEHVGLRNYRRLGQVIDRCLRPNGRGLIHSIGRNRPERVNSWIERRVFPGSYAPTLQEMTRVLYPFNFSVLDVENLRLHYAETLRHWLDRYERSVDLVRRMFDDTFVRMWRLYLAGSMVAFAAGGLQLFQVLFNRGQDNDIPRTRGHLHTETYDPRPSDWSSFHVSSH